MNDYMFRAVLQENKNVLEGLICSLLHLNPKAIKSTVILNPIELGKSFDDKTFVLDVKVLLNDASIIDLEMQVSKQDFWNSRSLSYLCSIFQNLERGDDYELVKPAYHISILDFSPFPDYPEFYALIRGISSLVFVLTILRIRLRLNRSTHMTAQSFTCSRSIKAIYKGFSRSRPKSISILMNFCLWLVRKLFRRAMDFGHAA